MHTRKIKDIMTKDPACCEPDTSLQETAKMMCENDCGEIPVVDAKDGSRLVGVITDRDITCRAVSKGENPQVARVSDFMTTDFVAVTEGTTIADCLKLLEHRRIRRVPVIDEHGCCIGIVSQADLARKAPASKTAELLREVSQPMRV